MNDDEQRACDVVRGFFASLSNGDLEAVREMLHPAARWEVMRAAPAERLTVGRDAIIDEFLTPVRARFTPGDPKVTVQSIFASGNHVAAETHGDGSMADGRPYHNRYAWMIELDDGMLREIREYMDTAYARASHRVDAASAG